MACSAVAVGRALPCKDSLGGIKQIWISPWAISGVPIDWAAVTAGEIANITTSTAVVFKNYDMHKNTGSFTQTVNASVENGTIFYTQVVSCVFSNEVAADISNFQDLTKGRLAICVQDVNDNVFVMGHTRGVELTGGTLESGVAMGDFNGLKYEFTAEEFIAAPFLTMTTPAVPTGDMVTFTPTAS
tara:strand:- start:646 stop:1203 length:558 start_codon:yes stop_codon:yes gene_type:complete